MRKAPKSNDCLPAPRQETGFVWWPIVAVLLLVCGLAAIFALSNQRPSSPPSPSGAAASPAAKAEQSSIATNRSPKRSQVVSAAWYEVPLDSLAKRRAGLHELTAAHNTLPIGTLLRVTHLENGKSVNVRVTDRGIRDRRVKLDVCKEAADELEMISKGIARVRMEVVVEEQGASQPESHTAAPQP